VNAVRGPADAKSQHHPSDQAPHKPEAYIDTTISEKRVIPITTLSFPSVVLLVWTIHFRLIRRSGVLKSQFKPLLVVTLFFVLCNWNAHLSRDVINCWVCILILMVTQAHNCIHVILYSLHNFAQDSRRQLYSPAAFYLVLVSFCVATLSSLWTLGAGCIYIVCIYIPNCNTSAL
jgi:hypothetical protein